MLTLVISLFFARCPTYSFKDVFLLTKQSDIHRSSTKQLKMSHLLQLKYQYFINV